MNVERLKKTLYKAAKAYLLYVMLPCGVYLAIFTGYYYIESPEMFSYQKINCPYDTELYIIGCSEPVTANSIITGEFTPRIVNDTEYERLANKSANYQLMIIISYMVAGGYILQRWIKKNKKE